MNVEQAQKKFREQGMCGELVEDGKKICMLERDHTHEYDDLIRHIENGIKNYAVGELQAFSYHGDGSALESMAKLEEDASDLARYIVNNWRPKTHE